VLCCNKRIAASETAQTWSIKKGTHFTKEEIQTLPFGTSKNHQSLCYVLFHFLTHCFGFSNNCSTILTNKWPWGFPLCDYELYLISGGPQSWIRQKSTWKDLTIWFWRYKGENMYKGRQKERERPKETKTQRKNKSNN
jgi:hypothetical protein